jgi:hypothetical protein
MMIYALGKKPKVRAYGRVEPIRGLTRRGYDGMVMERRGKR